MRCTIQPKLDGNVIYTPQALSDSQLAGGVLKRAAAGAAFLGRLSKLTSLKSTKMVWDSVLKSEPPATLRPTKPKFYLMKSITLEPGLFYQLK